MALHNDDLLYLGILLNTWIIKINISQTEINCNTLHATALENFHHNLDFPLASPAEQELEGQSKKKKKERDRIEVEEGREGEKEREKEQERMNDIKEPNSVVMQHCSDLNVQPSLHPDLKNC